MSQKLNRVGEKYYTNQKYQVEIIEYVDSYHVTVKFNDEKSTIVDNLRFGNILRGKVLNPNHKSVWGVGYLGQGKYSMVEDKKITLCYRKWAELIRRCYSKEFLDRNLTYKDCIVDERWHNFQNFAKWFENNYTVKFDLDKDILIKGNKIYSPETCCFVPHEINTLFVKCNKGRGEYPIGVHFDKKYKKFITQLNIDGKRINMGGFDTPKEAFEAYKIAKENEIKRVADKWKPLIKPNVYKAMYAYEVEITD